MQRIRLPKLALVLRRDWGNDIYNPSFVVSFKGIPRFIPNTRKGHSLPIAPARKSAHSPPAAKATGEIEPGVAADRRFSYWMRWAFRRSAPETFGRRLWALGAVGSRRLIFRFAGGRNTCFKHGLRAGCWFSFCWRKNGCLFNPGCAMHMSSPRFAFPAKPTERDVLMGSEIHGGATSCNT